ncbi:hypothetical protein AWB67_04743 [Caballeronia terrestris]|uniref:Lipoprotein n=1 Tax=Caballeronia terrestris TaxID=1226301 RepID=A0A158K2H4_9BURK|nr:hypothetical protein AWB67_04743 [Caballeronia terrestris]
MNKRLVNSLVLSAALLGAWPAAAADEEDSARHDSDRPVAKLLDANGRVVGKLVYFDYGGYITPYERLAQGGVILNIQGVLAYASVVRSNPADESVRALKWYGNPGYFSGPNCSGEVYVLLSAFGPLRPAAIVRKGPKATLYVASSKPRETVTLRSGGGYTPSGYINPDIDCNDYGGQTTEIKAWKIGSTFDLTQHYPEPLRIGF